MPCLPKSLPNTVICMSTMRSEPPIELMLRSALQIHAGSVSGRARLEELIGEGKLADVQLACRQAEADLVVIFGGDGKRTFSEQIADDVGDLDGCPVRVGEQVRAEKRRNGYVSCEARDSTEENSGSDGRGWPPAKRIQPSVAGAASLTRPEARSVVARSLYQPAHELRLFAKALHALGKVLDLGRQLIYP